MLSSVVTGVHVWLRALSAASEVENTSKLRERWRKRTKRGAAISHPSHSGGRHRVELKWRLAALGRLRLVFVKHLEFVCLTVEPTIKVTRKLVSFKTHSNGNSGFGV